MKIDHYYSWGFSVALAALAYGFALTDGSTSVLTLSQGAVLLVSALGMMTPGRGHMHRHYFVLLCMLFAILLSTVLFNIASYSEAGKSPELAISHAFGMIALMLSLQWASTVLRPHEILRNIAILLLPLIALAVIEGLSTGGLNSRQNPLNIHPNWWGELGFAFTVCALALPQWKYRAVMIAFVTALFLLVQSRGALIASAVSLSSYLLFSTRSRRPLTPSPRMLVWIPIMLAAIAIIINQYQSGFLLEFMRDDVLRFNDPYRGIDSGLTGRISGWQEAVDVFMANPILGSGLDTLTHVHNGFLRLAGEGGAVLLLTIIALIVIGFRNAIKVENYLAASIILGYIAYAITYPRMLNMNLASVVFYFALFPWNSDRQTFRIRRSIPVGYSNTKI